MNNKLLAVLAAALLAVGSQSSAQDTLLDYVVDACEGDLKQYCSQVTPGEGRLLHCVAAHQDKLSGQCEYALYRAATLLEQMAAAISYVARSCETEIKTLCSDVQAGEGRILACLEANSEQVGDGCKKAVTDTVEQ